MSLKRLSTAAGEENHTAEKMFKYLHDVAIQKVVSDFTGGLSSEFKFNNTIQKRKIGNTGKNFTDYTPRKGIYLERYSDDCFQLLKIGKVSFKSDRECKSIVFFETEFSVEQREVEIKAGKNIINLNYETIEDTLCVYFNNNFEIAESTNNGCGCNDICDNCSCSCGCFYGRLFDDKFDEKHFTGSNGLSFEISCKCNEKPLICEFADDLCLAIQMQMGIELMTEVLVSDGKHPLVRNGEKDARILLSKWKGGEDPISGFSEDSEYWKIMKPIIAKAKTYLENESTKCVECKHEIGYFESV